MESLLIAIIFGLYGYGYMKFAIAIFILLLLFGSANLNFVSSFFLYNAIIYYYHGSYGVVCALTFACIYIFIGLAFLLDIQLSCVKNPDKTAKLITSNDKQNNIWSYVPYSDSQFIGWIYCALGKCYTFMCAGFDAMIMTVAENAYHFKTHTNNIAGFAHIYRAYHCMVSIINFSRTGVESFRSLYRLSKTPTIPSNNRTRCQTHQPSTVQSIEPDLCTVNKIASQLNMSDDSDSDSLDEHADQHADQHADMNFIGDLFNGNGVSGTDIKQLIELEAHMTDDQKKQRSEIAEKMFESIFGKKSSNGDLKKMFSNFDNMMLNKKNI